MIRVGDTYYMSSTTMHLSPGLPIMKSKDLVNWELVSYAYDILMTWTNSISTTARAATVAVRGRAASGFTPGAYT